MRLTHLATACVAAASFCCTARAATLLSDPLDVQGSWTVNATADTAATFGYDYSADSIPEAPNSVGGAATTGLKLEANIVAPGALEELAVAAGLSLSGIYTFQADMWINANGPFPGGGAGSTEFGGASVNHDGTSTSVNGTSFLVTGEGGSGTDWRFLEGSSIAVGYNASEEPVVSQFPGVAPPAGQGQTGVTQDGSGGFQWLTIEAIVNNNTGLSRFKITSELGGMIDSGLLTAGAGSDVALIYADYFSSVSGNAAQSFGLFDNVVVASVPEPSSVLLVLAGVAAVAVRRFRTA